MSQVQDDKLKVINRLDPMLWIERLRDVNLDSEFTDEEKTVIDTGLKAVWSGLNKIRKI